MKNGPIPLLLFLAAFLLCLSPGVFAARVFGQVYDDTLSPLSKAIVVVNTTPEQRQVTTNGSYEFALPPGAHLLLAQMGNWSASHEFEVKNEGDFRIDLIAFEGQAPADFASLELVFNQSEVSVPASKPVPSPFPWVIAGLCLLLAAAYFASGRYRSKAPDRPPFLKDGLLLAGPFTRKSFSPASAGADFAGSATPAQSSRHPPLSPDQQRIVRALHDLNGRASQKELRKQLSEYSEAKVSIELTELEDKGVIVKIKKGRGNVIRFAEPLH